MDEKLLELVRLGDLHGLAGLYDRHGAACLAAAMNALDGSAVAETLVFDVFLMTWREPPVGHGSIREFLVARTLAMAQHLHP